MNLTKRIAKLEAESRPGRCETCKGWPDVRVEYHPPENSDPEPESPGACPSCGWRPMVIEVRRVSRSEFFGSRANL